MMHLYYAHHKRPADILRVTIGVSWCNRQEIRERLTNVIEEVTCDACRKGWKNWNMEETVTMTTTEMTGPQIVAKYNELAATKGRPTVKKFRTLEIAKSRLAAMEAMEIKKVTKKRGLDQDTVITVLSPDAFAAKKNETEAMKRFKKMVKSQCKTVGDYLKIGGVGDLKWWADRKLIRMD